MITKFKVFTLKAKDKYYGKRSAYYFDKAIEATKRGDYKQAGKYQDLARKYLNKHCGTTIDLVGMAR